MLISVVLKSYTKFNLHIRLYRYLLLKFDLLIFFANFIERLRHVYLVCSGVSEKALSLWNALVLISVAGRDGSVVKCICCSCRNPHQAAHNCLTSISEALTTPSGFHRHLHVDGAHKDK